MKRNRLSLRPVSAIAAVIAAGALLASCSSSSDSSADTSTSSSASTSAAAAGTSVAADSPVAGELKDASSAFLDAVNSGQVDAILAASCKKVADNAPADAVDEPAREKPIVVDKIENVMVDGDSATADVTAFVQGAPEIAPQTDTLKFVNENGWKVCQ